MTVINGANNTTATVAVGSAPIAVAVDPINNKIYVANCGSICGGVGASNLTVIDGSNNSTAAVVTGSVPQVVVVNQATTKVYVANGGSNSVTVIDGTNNTTLAVPTGGSNPIAAAVDLFTNKTYVGNNASGSVTAITPVATNVVPLNTVITPLPGNTTSNLSPTFTLTATSTYSPTAPPPRNIYFQLDTANGPWTRASNTSSTANTVTANAPSGVLQNGVHIIYFYASNGMDATSGGPNRPHEDNFWNRSFDVFTPESSPVTGGINAYLFLVGPGGTTGASVSVSGRVVTAYGGGIGNVHITLTDSSGNRQSAISSAFGYYRFTTVSAGETYVISVSAKRFTFIQPSKAISINDVTNNVDFIADPIE
ncbi:MAG: carboxypeptidase regulatory-like domain-containing protein [Acidobacteriota bacterium]